MQSDIILNRDRAKQLLAYDGMLYGKCRPTDIDFSMDFGGKVFIFGELKGANAPLTVGQRLHLQFLCDALEKGGAKAYAIVANHDTADCEHDVMVAQARVTKVYSQGKWLSPENTVTVNELIGGIYEDEVA